MFLTSVALHVASLAVFAPKHTSCSKPFAPCVAFATVTEASFNAVACLGTTAIVYTAEVSFGAVFDDSTFACDPMT